MDEAFNIGLGICAFFAAANWLGLASAVLGKRNFSFAPPLFMGLMGVLLIATHPMAALHAYWWLPLLLDPSIAFALVGFAITVLVRRLRARAEKHKPH